MTALKEPSSSAGSGVRALVVAPTRELAHQIHNECLKLAQGRKWRVVLFSKATASTLAEKSVRNKVGKSRTLLSTIGLCLKVNYADIIVSTPLRLVAAIQAGNLELQKYVESH